MTYAYDVLLNFTDEDRFIEFYEWDDKDYIEHIERIPIFYIHSEDLMIFFKSNIKISNDFLLKIKDRTSCYERYGNLEYSCIFSDGNRALAMEFNDGGLSIARSSLLIDEESEIIDETIDDNYIEIDYEIVNHDSNSFITRNDSLRKRYLLLELRDIKENKEVDKLNFLYSEIFENDNLSFDKKLNKLISGISNNFDWRYNHLYDIMRFMHTIKK